MKRIFSLIVVCLLAVPSSTIAAQVAAPGQDAPISAWHSWFKSLRRPTRQDALRAQQFVKSKWRCMLRGQDCSATERNSLRALAAAAAAAIAAAVGFGYQKKKRDKAVRSQVAQQAQSRLQRDAARPDRNREVAIRQLILELKANEETIVPAQAVIGRRPITVHEWGTPAGVAEAAIWISDVDLLQRLIQEKAVNLKKHNVNLSSVLHHKYSASPANSKDFMKVIVKAPGVDPEYLSQEFGEYNQTLLYEVVKEYPDPEFVKLLLEAGIHPATAGIGGEDALLSAVEAFIYARNRREYGDVLRTIKLLVTHGSNPQAEARFGPYRGKTVRQIAEEALEIALEKGDHYPRSQDDVDSAMKEVEEALTITGRTVKSAAKR